MGGWLQGGGLAGATGMRMFGYGADQVLQVELVTPSGHHVRFGPVQVVRSRRHLQDRGPLGEGKEVIVSTVVPTRTLRVAGECNAVEQGIVESCTQHRVMRKQCVVAAG